VLAITREALSNVARHSAASRASIRLSTTGESLSLVIDDNGRGFDVNEERSSSHRGLANLRSRAEALGGKLNVDSRHGAGTHLELTMPLAHSRTASI
jgi:signal transduction histidine kinase